MLYSKIRMQEFDSPRWSCRKVNFIPWFHTALTYLKKSSAPFFECLSICEFFLSFTKTHLFWDGQMQQNLNITKYSAAGESKTRNTYFGMFSDITGHFPVDFCQFEKNYVFIFKKKFRSNLKKIRKITSFYHVFFESTSIFSERVVSRAVCPRKSDILFTSFHLRMSEKIKNL